MAKSILGRKRKSRKNLTGEEVAVVERKESLRSKNASDAVTLSIQGPPLLNAQELLNECLHDGDPLLENTQISKRHAIGYMFIDVYKAPIDKTKWDKIALAIKKAFHIPIRTDIKPIFINIIECKKAGITWSPKKSFSYKGGRDPIIGIDSEEAQIIADAVEKGCGRKMAKEIVNMYRKNHQLEALTESTVYYCIVRMGPLVRVIGFRPQGSKETEDSPGSIARLRSSLQTALRLQIPGADTLLQNFMEWKQIAIVPEYFKMEMGDYVCMYNIIMWGETHRQCSAGTGDMNPSMWRHHVQLYVASQETLMAR